MTRQEFLSELQNTLMGSVSQAKINEHVNYYNNYIIEESRKGKTEEEVVALLGNPRLIAKTILSVDAQEWESDAEYGNVCKDRESNEQKGFHAKYEDGKGWDVRYGRFRLNSWYAILLLFFILLLFLFLVGKLLVLLLPILLPVLLVVLIFICFGNK